MSDIIRIKIDVTKIDKARLFQGKNGAQYLDATLLPSRNSQYGDSHMIVQDVTKEERLAGTKGAILGNAKTLEKRTDAPRQETETRTFINPPAAKPAGPDEDIPF